MPKNAFLFRKLKYCAELRSNPVCFCQLDLCSRPHVITLNYSYNFLL